MGIPSYRGGVLYCKKIPSRQGETRHLMREEGGASLKEVLGLGHVDVQRVRVRVRIRCKG
jgi:hypothetical protein